MANDNVAEPFRSILNSIFPETAARPADAPARCPDCGADVPTIFEHIDGCPPAKRPDVDGDDDMFGDDEPGCTDPGGHKFVCTGTQYGGDDESYHGEGRCYCEHCGADGDA